MSTYLKHKLIKSLKVTAVLLFTGFTFAALGSIGGGNKTKSNSILKPGFTPIRTTRGFTLRSGLTYTGSLTLHENRTNSSIDYTSLVTYEKGNTTYILPNHYKLSVNSCNSRSNLQLLHLNIRITK